MRVVVASPFPIDSIQAHAINVIKIADGFADNGCDVQLITREPKSKPFDENAFRANFALSDRVTLTPVKRRLLGIKLGRHFAFGVQATMQAHSFNADLCYFRSYAAPVIAIRLSFATIAESHVYPDNRRKIQRRMFRDMSSHYFRGLITINESLKENYVQRGASPEKTHVLPDAVDPKLFLRQPIADQLIADRRRQDPRPLAVYAGHLYEYKGIAHIIEAASRLPSVRFQLLGGFPDDMAKWRNHIATRGLSNVEILGHVPHANVARYLWYADVLLLPPSAQHPSARWTSPVKLGEYMASGTPIVLTDIPALRRWVGDHEAWYCAPDNGEDLANAISRVLSNPETAEQKSEAARTRVDELSYQSRCKKILELGLGSS